jgi:hypothetical protein
MTTTIPTHRPHLRSLSFESLPLLMRTSLPSDLPHVLNSCMLYLLVRTYMAHMVRIWRFADSLFIPLLPPRLTAMPVFASKYPGPGESPRVRPVFILQHAPRRILHGEVASTTRRYPRGRTSSLCSGGRATLCILPRARVTRLATRISCIHARRTRMTRHNTDPRFRLGRCSAYPATRKARAIAASGCPQIQ